MSNISENIQAVYLTATQWLKEHVFSLGSLAGWYLIGGGATILLLGIIGINKIFGIIAILLGAWIVYDKEK